MPTSYCPHLDIPPVLRARQAVYYMSFIGILILMVKLNRVDIRLKVSEMSSHMTMPSKTKLVFDPSDPVMDMPMLLVIIKVEAKIIISVRIVPQYTYTNIILTQYVPN